MNAYKLVKQWYTKEFPTDELGEEINDKLSFYDVFKALDNYKDIYEVIGVGDSIVRERIFFQLAKIMNVDYSYIYEQWLK